MSRITPRLPLKFPLKLDSHNCNWPKKLYFRICLTNIFFMAPSYNIRCNSSSKKSVYVSDYTNTAPPSSHWNWNYTISGFVEANICFETICCKYLFGPHHPLTPRCIDADWWWHISLLKLLLRQILFSCGWSLSSRVTRLFLMPTDNKNGP